jgi:ribosomal protein S21
VGSLFAVVTNEFAKSSQSILRLEQKASRMSKTKPDPNPHTLHPALQELQQILAREQTLEEFRKRYGYDPSEPSRKVRAREARRKVAEKRR